MVIFKTKTKEFLFVNPNTLAIKKRGDVKDFYTDVIFKYWPNLKSKIDLKDKTLCNNTKQYVHALCTVI